MTTATPFCGYEYLQKKQSQNLDSLVMPKIFLKGDYLYLPTDNLDIIYVIKTGVVKLGGYATDGREAVYDVIGPDEFIGNLKYLTPEFFNEFAKALTPVSTIAYNLRFLKEMLLKEQLLQEWFTQLIVKRWARAEARLFRIAAMKPEERIQQLLKELDTLLVEESGKKYRAFDVLTKQDLADLAGMTRQTAAKVFRQLENL